MLPGRSVNFVNANLPVGLRLGDALPLDFGEALPLEATEAFLGDYLKRLIVRERRAHMLLEGIWMVVFIVLSVKVLLIFVFVNFPNRSLSFIP